MNLHPISVLHELERIGWNTEHGSENELKVKCPFHGDNHPSCSINIENKMFKCQTAGCGKSGDIITFLAGALQTSRQTVCVDIAKRYDLDDTPPINPKLIEQYHSDLQGPLLQELYDRALTDDIIRTHRLGRHENRITIPIYNKHGSVVNIRKYLPGAPNKQKMRNLKGRGKIRLYPIEQLKYERILICGGELKALVAAAALNSENIGAISTTGGEGSWDSTFSIELANKRAYVCFDVDSEGSKGADRVAAQLKSCSIWVAKLNLPLDRDRFPHGDINDFFSSDDSARGKLIELIENATEWKPELITAEIKEEAPVNLPLAASVNAKYTGKRIRVDGLITTMDTSPYVVPRTVQVHCDRAQEGCSICPIFAKTVDEDTIHTETLHPESPAIIDMVAEHQIKQHKAIMSGLGIPDSCKSVNFKPSEYYNVEDVRLTPQIEIASRAVDHIVQPALTIGLGCELNENYSFTGRMYPHPKTQQSILLISEYEAKQDVLSSFDVDCRDLSRFSPNEWSLQGLENKLNEIYSELEVCVTRIFERRDLHLAVDLCYHSPLLLNLDGNTVRGWTEVLVLGDSSQGKSETVQQLMAHYGLGEKMDCKNATVAGLLGGLQQLGTRWFVTWGVIPTHDQRLVVLEELKGADPAVISKLTDMRSSGIAEIPKIEKRRTHARTRLLALSNPRSDQPLSTYNFGIEAVKELVGNLEDVRRFDFTLLVSSNEIDATRINEFQRIPKQTGNLCFDSDLCRKLILWGWTRKPEDVVFDDYNRVLDRSADLCNSFSELIPVVDKGSMRYKLARLAASLAVRTFSNEDETKIRVRDCHVEYTFNLLNRIYSSDTFGYKGFTDAVELSNQLLNPEMVIDRLRELPFPVDFVNQITATHEITLQDISDWTGWDRGEATQLLSLLVRKHCLKRLKGREYAKTPAFIELLKTVSVEDRPDFIGEEF